MASVGLKKDYAKGIYTIRTPKRDRKILEYTKNCLIKNTKLKVAQTVKPAIRVEFGSESETYLNTDADKSSDSDKDIQEVIRETVKEELYNTDSDLLN